MLVYSASVSSKCRLLYNSQGLVPNACQILDLNARYPVTLPQLPYYPFHYLTLFQLPSPNYPITHSTTLTLFPFALVPLLPLYPCTLYTVYLVYTLVPCMLYTVYWVYTLVPCILGIYPSTLYTGPSILVPCTLYTVPCILYTLCNCILLLIFDRSHGCQGAAPVPCGPLPRFRFPVCRCRWSRFHLWFIGFPFSICP